MKRTLSLFCCSLYLLPLAVLARPAKPHAAPRAAPVTVQMPINSQAVDSAGTTYLLTGTLTLTVTPANTTPPIPPVEAPNLSYLSISPTAVQGGQSATLAVVLTKVVPAGTTANVLLKSPDPGVQVPGLLAVPAGASLARTTITTTAGVPVEKLVAITGTYNGKSASANLRVLADSVTPPTPGVSGAPNVLTYRLADGSPLVGLPLPGSEVRIGGQGFGSAPGRVVWQGDVLPVLAWTDTEVRVRMPLYSSQGQWEFVLFRPDGQWCNMSRPLDVQPPNALRQ